MGRWDAERLRVLSRKFPRLAARISEAANILTLDANFTALMNTLFAKIDDRFAKMDDRFAALNSSMDKRDVLFAKMDDRFAKMDDRLTKLTSSMDKREQRHVASMSQTTVGSWRRTLCHVHQHGRVNLTRSLMKLMRRQL